MNQTYHGPFEDGVRISEVTSTDARSEKRQEERSNNGEYVSLARERALISMR